MGFKVPINPNHFRINLLICILELLRACTIKQPPQSQQWDKAARNFHEEVYKLPNLSSQTLRSSSGHCTGLNLFGEGFLTQLSSLGEIKYQDIHWEQKNPFQWQSEHFVSSPQIAFPRASPAGGCYHLWLCWVGLLRFAVNLHSTSEKCKNH